MKNSLKLVSLFMLLLVSSFTFGQKFGHLNSQEILAALPESEDAQNQLKEQAQKHQDKIEIMQVEYNKKLNAYMEGIETGTLSGLDKSDSETELKQMQERMQKYQENAQKELNNSEMELVQPILIKINDAIKAIGKKNNYVYVFDKAAGAIIFEGDGAKDISEDIINEVYKDNADKKAKALANLQTIRSQAEEAQN